ncbi:YjbE family putative metal transport protein [Mesorhizobium sp. CN5-321]|jgi:YjbE family integral membrane protein|uniref:YjbE family putative metal transport protein n=1 Tax=Mesorhizobium hunchu TaxID=3157708 RepID=UPI0032B779C5
MPFGIDQSTVLAYLEVIAINLVLSGDNVIVIGMAAAGLAAELRQKAIFIGIAAATVIRIVFAVIAVEILAITGITLLGGLLLFWVCWNMFKELRAAGEPAEEPDMAGEGAMAPVRPPKKLSQAIVQIIVADLSMSLDNVLAVAGAAQENIDALIFGLVLSVVLMAAASTLVAKLLAKYRWIGWIGLAIIVYVALGMIVDGVEDLMKLDYSTLLGRAAPAAG